MVPILEDRSRFYDNDLIGSVTRNFLSRFKTFILQPPRIIVFFFSIPFLLAYSHSRNLFIPHARFSSLLLSHSFTIYIIRARARAHTHRPSSSLSCNYKKRQNERKDDPAVAPLRTSLRSARKSRESLHREGKCKLDYFYIKKSPVLRILSFFVSFTLSTIFPYLLFVFFTRYMKKDLLIVDTFIFTYLIEMVVHS